MNKKLLAVAVAGALAAPVAAFAQSSVTLYGSADVSYGVKNHRSATGSVSHTQGIMEGLHAGNRIGFRGTEDLGGGMSAQFVIENGINLTNGALFSTRAAAAGQQVDGVSTSPGSNHPAGAYSAGTNRQSFVGLKGAWGEVLAGYQYNNLYRVSTLNGYMLGSEQPGGDLAHGLVDAAFYGGTRANGWTYNSPVFGGGFQVTLQKGAGTGREDASFSAALDSGRHQNNVHRWSIMPTYNSGPWSVSLAYTKVKTDASGVIVNATACPLNVLGACSAQSTGATAASNGSIDADANLWQLGGSYTMGAWKIAGTYANGKKSDNGRLLDGVTAVANANTRSKAFQASLQYTMGAWRPFITLGSGESNNRTSGANINDLKLSQFGLRYDLSKRTLLYVMHGTTKDKVSTSAVTERKLTGVGMYMSF